MSSSLTTKLRITRHLVLVLSVCAVSLTRSLHVRFAVFPVLPALKEKQQAAQMILDQASDENLQKMSEIYSMLDNTLADEEDLSVAGATFT
eukprot:SAG11_NODE_2261_length_3608_cov_8.203192_1_plen_91_part_00